MVQCAGAAAPWPTRPVVWGRVPCLSYAVLCVWLEVVYVVQHATLATVGLAMPWLVHLGAQALGPDELLGVYKQQLEAKGSMGAVLVSWELQEYHVKVWKGMPVATLFLLVKVLSGVEAGTIQRMLAVGNGVGVPVFEGVPMAGITDVEDIVSSAAPQVEIVPAAMWCMANSRAEPPPAVGFQAGWVAAWRRAKELQHAAPPQPPVVLKPKPPVPPAARRAGYGEAQPQQVEEVSGANPAEREGGEASTVSKRRARTADAGGFQLSGDAMEDEEEEGQEGPKARSISSVLQGTGLDAGEVQESPQERAAKEGKLDTMASLAPIPGPAIAVVSSGGGGYGGGDTGDTCKPTGGYPGAGSPGGGAPVSAEQLMGKKKKSRKMRSKVDPYGATAATTKGGGKGTKGWQ